jgi:hypothetical protein
MEQAKTEHIDQWTPIKVMENRLQGSTEAICQSGTTQVAALDTLWNQ